MTNEFESEKYNFSKLHIQPAVNTVSVYSIVLGTILTYSEFLISGV